MKSLLAYLAFDRRSVQTILQKSIFMATDAKFKKAYVEGLLAKYKSHEIKEYLDLKNVIYKEDDDKN